MQTWIKANIGKLIERFGGMNLKLISATDYAALEDKDPETLYTVTDSEADTVKLYLGDKQIGDNINPITIIQAANLTGYSGDPNLGNGFEVTTAGGVGTIAVDSETIGGVTYNGLRISGGTTLQTRRYFGKMSTFEVEFIVNSYVSGINRLLSTGGTRFDFSIYASDDDYLHYVAADVYQVLDPSVDRIPDSGGNCTDNSITKASLLGAVTNIKFVDDGTYTTLYVNDVAKIKWLTGYANSSFFLYGQNIGANGIGGADVLITKLQWSANGIEYDEQNWVPI